MTVYHVTETKRLRSIKLHGLRSNWVNRSGARLGGGCVFAFEDKTDALKWAAKMDWGMHYATGSGKITILTIETTEDIWDPDFTDPLGQVGKAGRWLKAFQPIAASAIISTESFTQEHAKLIVEAL